MLPISNTVNSVTGSEKSETQATLKISLSFHLAMSISPKKSCIAFTSARLLFSRSEVTHLLRAPRAFTALPEPAAALNLSVVAFLFYSKRHLMFMDEIQLHNVPAATLVGYKKAEQVVVQLEKVVRVFTFGFDQEYSHYT